MKKGSGVKGSEKQNLEPAACPSKQSRRRGSEVECPHAESTLYAPISPTYLTALLETIKRYGWMPFALFITHVIFTLFHFYARWKILDVPLHFFGGIAIAFFVSGAITVFAKHNLIKKPDHLIHIALVFSLTCTAAIFWEFAEWIMDHTIASDCQLGRDDTMLDLFLGILGGSTLTLFLIIKGRGSDKKGRAQISEQATSTHGC